MYSSLAKAVDALYVFTSCLLLMCFMEIIRIWCYSCVYSSLVKGDDSLYVGTICLLLVCFMDLVRLLEPTATPSLLESSSLLVFVFSIGCLCSFANLGLVLCLSQAAEGG